jgi:hypothetical protein
VSGSGMVGEFVCLHVDRCGVTACWWGAHMYGPLMNRERGPRRGGVPRQFLGDGGAARGCWCRCLWGRRHSFPSGGGSDPASPTTVMAAGKGVPTAIGLGFPVNHGRMRYAQVRAMRLEKKSGKNAALWRKDIVLVFEESQWAAAFRGHACIIGIVQYCRTTQEKGRTGRSLDTKRC